MASSLSSSAIKAYGYPSRMAATDCHSISGSDCGGGTYGQASFWKNSKKRELSIVSVATDLPAVVQQPPPWKEEIKERKLAAWTSVRRDRWKGELVVQGEIPKWLV